MVLDLQLAIPKSIGDDFLVVGSHPFIGLMTWRETGVVHSQVRALLDVDESLKVRQG